MQVLEAGKTTIYCLAFTPEGEVVIGTKDGKVLIFSESYSPRLLGHFQPSFGLKISVYSLSIPTSGSVMVAIDFGTILLTTSDAETDPIEIGDVSGVLCVDYLDDQTILLGEGDRVHPSPGSFRLWSTKPPGRRLEPHFTEPQGVKAVAAHRPSRIVAWANGSNRVTIWDPMKQDPKHLNLKSSSPAIAFHPDGTKLAVALKWGVKLYDINKQYEVASFDGHKGRVTSVAFSLDGRVLATGSWDKTVRLWNVDNGKLIAAYEGPTGKVFTLAYAPDGMRLAAAGDAGNVVLWDVE